MKHLAAGSLKISSLRQADAWCLVPAVAVAFTAMWLGYVGYTGSDDANYAGAAEAWLHQPPYLGTTHWALRHCIVLPMAALFFLFGRSETTLILPTLLYTCGLAGLMAAFAFRLNAWRASAYSIALLGTIPVIATGATLVTTDIPEAFFVIASLWSFDAGKRKGGVYRFVLSGAAAGCGLITRETTIALLLFYAVLAAHGGKKTLPAFGKMALGFSAVVGADWLYLYLMSGDPLFRLHVAAAGARADGPSTSSVASGQEGIDKFGLLAVPRWLKPFTMLFSSQSFGLIFWLAVPATLALCVRGEPRLKYAVRMIGGLGAAWVLILGYGLSPWLWVLPRYFVVATCLVVPLAVWCTLSKTPPIAAWTNAAILIVLITNFALILSSTDIMVGEHAILRLAAVSGGVIYTDPATKQDVDWLLSNRGWSARVNAELPPPGSLYFFDGKPRRELPQGWPIKHPLAGWVLVRDETEGEKWTGKVIRLLRLEHLLPRGIVSKLDPKPPLLALYRLPAA